MSNPRNRPNRDIRPDIQRRDREPNLGQQEAEVEKAELEDEEDAKIEDEEGEAPLKRRRAGSR